MLQRRYKEEVSRGSEKSSQTRFFISNNSRYSNVGKTQRGENSKENVIGRSGKPGVNSVKQFCCRLQPDIDVRSNGPQAMSLELQVCTIETNQP